MPRTRATKKKSKNDIAEFCKEIEARVNEQIAEYEYMVDTMKTQLTQFLQEQRASIPISIGNKTLGELRRAGCLDGTTYFEAASIMSVLGASNKSRRLRRSLSLVEDEGYLTAASNGSGDSRSTQRSRSRQTKARTSARSLSRSKMKQTVTTLSSYKTPANKGLPMNTIGTITPKMKPNTPQVVLRRPKQGEIAVSMQGSPLLVAGVVSDNVANLNIPLADGRTISIQPQRGLRVSQLPPLDVDTQRQIQALRDNLNKMCAMAATYKR